MKSLTYFLIILRDFSIKNNQTHLFEVDSKTSGTLGGLK